MEALTRFRTNVDALSDAEFSRFILAFGRPKCIDILFRQYHESIQLPQTAKDKQTIDSFHSANGVISEIILSRKAKKCKMNQDVVEEEKKEKASMKINKLPDVMIANISSFLSFEHKLNFEKCNISLYLALLNF